MKIKIKDRVAIRIRKRLRKWEAAKKAKAPAVVSMLLAVLLASCAAYTPNIQVPPRLVLQQARACPDLEPLPFVKHSLAELDADAAVNTVLRGADIDLDAYPEPGDPEARKVAHILLWWR